MKKSSNLLESLRVRLQETASVYQPVFLRLNSATDQETFTKLLSVPGISVHDFIKDQIKELLKFRNAGRSFTPYEMEEAIANHLAKQEADLYGVWVYYPWSNRLVHILDKEEFIDVRTSRNQYKITREERDLLAQKKIGVIGLSVGQSVSVTLAMERICGELRLADFDLLELTNLNRIRTGVHNLGLAKVYSVAREVAEIDPYIKVVCFPQGLLEENMDDFFTRGGKLDLLVEESDGFDIKILSRYKARQLGVPVIMEASDRCMVDVERFDLEPTRSILHGIVDHLDVKKLKELKTNDEKIPYMLDVLGLSSTSPRLRASMLEMNQTINTWPQLASSVTMGGGITADVSRRILLNHFRQSGRYYVDIDELIGDKRPVTENQTTPLKQPSKGPDELKKVAQAYAAKQGSQINETDLEKIVEAGAQAPSYANRQPWTWLSLEQKLFLFYNGPSQPPFMDPGNDNSFISIGAAIENVHIRSAALGYLCEMDLLSPVDDRNLIAVFYFTQKISPYEDEPLSEFIGPRHTNRGVGNGKKINDPVLSELSQQAIKIEGASVSFITDPEKIKQVAQLNGVCERIRLLNEQAHDDFFKNELRFEKKKEVREGLDIKTMELQASVETAIKIAADPVVSGLLNTWKKGRAFEQPGIRGVISSSAIGLITMPAPTLQNYINGGRAVEKVWLAATKNNLAFQPICVSLSFLKHLGKNNQDKTFSEDHFSELKHVKEQLSLIFSELVSREAVLLFRLFEAEPQLNRSLKKTLYEVYHKSQGNR